MLRSKRISMVLPLSKPAREQHVVPSSAQQCRGGNNWGVALRAGRTGLYCCMGASWRELIYFRLSPALQVWG